MKCAIKAMTLNKNYVNNMYDIIRKMLSWQIRLNTMVHYSFLFLGKNQPNAVQIFETFYVYLPISQVCNYWSSVWNPCKSSGLLNESCICLYNLKIFSTYCLHKVSVVDERSFVRDCICYSLISIRHEVLTFTFHPLRVQKSSTIEIFVCLFVCFSCSKNKLTSTRSWNTINTSIW